jgi:uncharacterized protein (DUF305 family)
MGLKAPKAEMQVTMQINIDKKTGSLLAIIVLLVGTLIYVIGMRTTDEMSGMHQHMQSSSNGKYSGADIMFLQMMIPHHQQAIDMSNVAMQVSKNEELLALAKVIAKDQAAEIVQMKSWLKDAGASVDPGHSMSGMGGMLTSEEYAALEKASGADFDKLWLTGMTKHHDGAIHMTTMISDDQNAEIKSFGEAIVKVQTAQIDQMKLMLEKL